MDPRDEFPRVFTGACSLSCGSQAITDSPFELHQTDTGLTHFFCDGDNSSAPLLEALGGVRPMDAATTIGGRTIEGLSFSFSPCHYRGSRRPAVGPIRLHFSFRRTELNSGAKTPKTAIYYLTNLQFTGVDRFIEEGDGWSKMGLGIVFSAGGVACELRPLSGIHDIVRTISDTQTVGITAKLIVRSPHGGQRHGDELASRICSLLSFACGTTVTWLYADILDGSGNLIGLRSRTARVKEYVDARIIDTSVRGALKSFLETTLPEVVPANRTWNFEQSLDLFVDSKALDESLASKGLKVAICLEFLKAAYLKAHPEKKLLPAAEAFKARVSAGRKALDEVLRGLVNDPSDDVAVNRIRQRIIDAVRPSFRETLAGMCKEVGLPMPPEELRYLVKVRDKLVHTGTYDVKMGAANGQYLLLTGFMNRLLLRILKYDGWAGDQFVDMREHRLAPEQTE